jgi:uncharacterized protein YukE
VTPRPPDFEPLAGSDPVPGDPDEVAVIARRYRDTAAEIAKQASNLRTLASQAEGGWKGKAGKVFSSHASELADRISKAQGRYAATGDALSGWVRPLTDAQDGVYQAVWDAKAAQQQMTANAPPPPPAPGSPPPSPPTPDEQAKAKARSTAYGQAQTDLGTARTAFDRAVGDYHTAAGAAARKISDAIGHDGLKDSWWDRNFHWIKIVMEVIAVIVIVLAIAALLLACPFAAGFVLFGLTAETLATIAETALVVLTLVQLAYDSTAAATGKQSWTAAILDVVALATFGFGKLAAPALKALAEGGLDAGKVVSAGRAGRAFMEDNGLPGILYSLGSRSGLVRGAMSMFGKGPVIDGAIGAANDAKTALTELVEGAKPTNLQSLWSWSKEAATEVGKLNILGDKLPDVARVTFRQGVGQGLYVADGAVQWGGFATAGGYNAHAIVSETFSDEGVGQTLADFRHMLSAVP